MLNLNEIDKPIKALVPIKDNIFTYNRKRYSIDLEDGWYKVSLQGNNILECTPDYFTFENGKGIKGYTYNNNFIPMNFDAFKRKYGYEIMTNLYFNNVPTMSAIMATVWEDNKIFFVESDFTNSIIFEIQNCINEEGHVNIEGKKGLTPEIKTLLLFHSIERKNQIELKKKLEEEKRIEEYKKSMPGRLMLSFQEVGAEVLKYSIQGAKLIVDWAFKGFGQQFNSVIDANTFKIIEAGYCMSGDDSRHNIKSMVLTAKNYDEDGLIHITRRN